MQFLSSAERWPFLRPGLHSVGATSAATVKSPPQAEDWSHAQSADWRMSRAKPHLLTVASTARDWTPPGVFYAYIRLKVCTDGLLYLHTCAGVPVVSHPRCLESQSVSSRSISSDRSIPSP